ncbi:uncharacterized protein At1g21580 isoform X2 [Mercurialis annua]|uniref:uncharacterized protein At1g21580 isoform X2 n=1 Tax=Mercurialis annua TaxID=3986 RepID=UPI00215FF34A|nr:uncharacterized protein At1g21580 isoform X2 [Mercurialis annua]
MENRSVSGSYSHQSRYGYHHPTPPANHNPNLKSSPNYYQFRPPQPPPPSSQPPYHHHQHIQQQQQSFNSQNPHFFNFPQSPSQLPPPAAPSPQFIGGNRSDYRDHHHHQSSRVLNNQQQRTYHHHHDPGSYPINNVRHELVLESRNSDSRFIDEQKQQQQHRADLLFGSNSRGFSFGIPNNQIDDYDVVSKKQRWLHHHANSSGREAIGDVHNPMFIDRRSNEIAAGDSDGNRIPKQHYVNSELPRHSTASAKSSSSREGSYEYSNSVNRTPTPRKQPLLQKKSALLRIQKPIINKFRITRDDDHRGHHYDSKCFRGNKDKDLVNFIHPDNRGSTGEPSKEGIELDVSFKSNSLVAKAIVMPTADVADPNLAPMSGKLQKFLLPNKDSSSSSPSKPYEGAKKKLKSVVSVAIDTFSSDFNLKPSKHETKISDSSGTKVSLGWSNRESTTKGPETDLGGANVSSKTSSSMKAMKKKKFVKRPLKKAVNPNLRSSVSQPTNISDVPVIGGHSAYSEHGKDAAMTLDNDVDPRQCSNETIMMPDDNKVEAFEEGTTSENGTCTARRRLCMPKNRRKRSRSTSPLNDNNMVNDGPTNCSHDISQAEKYCTDLQSEITSSDIGSAQAAGKQLCHRGDTLLLEDNAANANSTDYLHATSIASKDCTKSPNETGRASSSNMALEIKYDNGLSKSTEGTAVSDNAVVEGGCKQTCTDKDNSSLESGIADQLVNANFSERSGKLWQLTSGEMTNQNADTHASCSVEGVRTFLGSDNGHLVSSVISLCSRGSSSKQPFADGAGTSFENVPRGRLLNGFASMGGSEEDDTSNNKIGEIPQLDLCKSEINDAYVEPVNSVRSACWVDTTLRLSFKDPTLLDFTVSGNGCGDVGVRPFVDGSVDFLEAGVSSSSSINVCPDTSLLLEQKKRKVSSCQVGVLSLTASSMIEEPLIADIPVLSVDLSSSSDGGQTQLQSAAMVSAMDPLRSSDLAPLQKETIASLHCSGGGNHSTTAPLRDVAEDDGLRCVFSCSTEELAVPKVTFRCPTGFESDQSADEYPVILGIRHQKNSIYAESGEVEKRAVDAAEEQHNTNSGTPECIYPSELHTLNSDGRLPGVGMEDENSHHVKTGVPCVAKSLTSPRDSNGVSGTDTSSEVMELALDALSNMDCHLSITLESQHSIEDARGDDGIILRNPVIQSGSSVTSVTSGSVLNTKFNLNFDHAVENAHSFSRKTGTLPSKDTKSSTWNLNANSKEKFGMKNQQSHVVSNICPGRSSFVYTASKNAASSNYISKPRTWHRTDSPFPSAPPGDKVLSSIVPKQSQKVAKFQSTSYIRKGNSLVRKPASVAAQSQGFEGLSSSANQLISSTAEEVKKNAACDTRISLFEVPGFVRSGLSASFERPTTPPLPNISKTRNHSTNALRDCLSLPAEPLSKYATETASDPVTSAESDDMLFTSEAAIEISENPVIQTAQINNVNCYTRKIDKSVVSSNANSITYVKRKLNQLVATSNLCSLTAKNTPPLLTDGYYKRRKNQLIRSSQEFYVNSTASMPDERATTEGQTHHSITLSSSLSKRLPCKVATKTRKASKSSLVWTLHSAQSVKDDSDSLHHLKVLPERFPWKRATYWRSFMPSSAANSVYESSSTIRKLLLLRKRDTEYTRSKHGFSLRKSKVLSVGGSSLKWSKSIERQSKKANEEATLAVVEAERKKREKNCASHVGSLTKRKHSSSRERIFRIGSVRYKMDSSRRTLQRISDDESSGSAALQTVKDAKRIYVPRRLMIGKHDYVRIGNGNKLVRDPKKRTRILASEKVRWSLHTARSRLAKKQKYCQFFTRFGKCNKDDGKCPFIHDSSKIAVCTKFLNGLCFNPECKLTHKVIPERMPDCSYYLQGLCTNKNCPYRHVHVNPNASTCEGFLRGYCTDGDECRKKHTYVCPTYEATGSCPQGSKCKLHHPKNRSKGKKSKQVREKKSTLGRYFGPVQSKMSEPGMAVFKKPAMEDDGNFFLERNIADYISLNASDGGGENSNPADEQTSSSNCCDMLDFQLVDLDEVIKPVRIMNT